MNTEKEPSNNNVPGEPISAATTARITFGEPARQPFVRLPFFLWTPLFIFVAALLVYFFYPDALNQAIKVAYNKYTEYAPVVIVPHLPHPVAAAQAPEKVAPPPPAQTYSIQEIKDGVQDHLLEFGMVDKGTAFDWKKLEYTDATDLTYELYARLARGTTEFCMGTVVLDMQEHKMVITSQLQGW